MAYKWTFTTIGGNTRVHIAKGEDFRHLGELDEKMWTVLSCPTTGLEISDHTLRLMDSDHDGKIRIDEVVATANYLCAVLKDPEILLEEKDALKIADLNEENADAKQMADVARKIAGEAETIDLAAVKAAVTAIAVEQKPLPEAPLAADIIAAIHANEGDYNAWFRAAELEKMGLAVTDPEKQPKITEKDWKKLTEKVAAYEAEVAAVNAANQAAVDAATGEYQPLIKLLHLKRDFYTLLKNYISFQDFYNKEVKAIFQCGRLVIDQRACELCVRVADAGKMAAEASKSGMYLLFCDCENKPQGKKMSIVAAMTQGDIHNLEVGKNCIFYDRNGLDYDAVVTKIIDNPISIRQAFWTPYRKFANWVSDLVNKSVAEKESKGLEDMKANATAATEKAKENAEKGGKAEQQKPAFDIAKFAGIFAAIGMALGMIGTALAAVASGLADLKWWQLLIVFAAIILVISGPSMLLAYFKLRRRNLAPVLNANGWAVNAEAIINVPFGVTLTSQAKFPVLKLKDPFAKKGLPAWAKILITLAVLLVIACGIGAYMYFTQTGYFAPKAEVECVEAAQAEAPAEQQAPVENAGEQAPAAE
ncbi:MAG: phage holin family protein [Paludibacteraceae bacterium]|nr:phage holin family protein [Paludibacteraceae bacterium]